MCNGIDIDNTLGKTGTVIAVCRFNNQGGLSKPIQHLDWHKKNSTRWFE